MSNVTIRTVDLLAVVPVVDAELSGDTATLGVSHSPDVVEVTTVASGGGSFSWTNEWTATLLAVYDSHVEKFSNVNYKKKAVWAIILDDMVKAMGGVNPRPTSTQAMDKWKTLVNAFKRVKDHNSKSGNDKKTCQFFKELQTILCDKANIRPVAVSSPGSAATTPVSRKSSSTSSSDNSPAPSPACTSASPSPAVSRGKSQANSVSDDGDSDSEEVAEVGKETQPPPKKIKKKLTATSVRTNVLNLAASLQQGQKERQESAERRHKEKLEKLDAMTALLQRIAEK